MRIQDPHKQSRKAVGTILSITYIRGYMHRTVRLQILSIKVVTICGIDHLKFFSVPVTVQNVQICRVHETGKMISGQFSHQNSHKRHMADHQHLFPLIMQHPQIIGNTAVGIGNKLPGDAHLADPDSLPDDFEGLKGSDVRAYHYQIKGYILQTQIFSSFTYIGNSVRGKPSVEIAVTVALRSAVSHYYNHDDLRMQNTGKTNQSPCTSVPVRPEAEE